MFKGSILMLDIFLQCANIMYIMLTHINSSVLCSSEDQVFPRISHMVPLHLLSLFSYFSTWYRHLYYLDRDTGSLYLSGSGPKHLSRYVFSFLSFFQKKDKRKLQTSLKLICKENFLWVVRMLKS